MFYGYRVLNLLFVLSVITYVDRVSTSAVNVGLKRGPDPGSRPFGYILNSSVTRPETSRLQTYNFSAVDQLLTQNVTAIYNGGVVCLIEKDGKLIYRNQLGNLMTTSSAAVASVSKTFSAAVLLSLVDEGNVALDDSIGKYLPLFTQYKKGGITIRQLFSHTSGLPNTPVGANRLTLAESVDQIARTVPLSYRPGTAFSYGGTSMQVAGRLAEVVTGQSWTTLFRERVVKPCGLTNTAFCLPPYSPLIAGGLCSTPDDVLRFARMLLNNGQVDGKQVLSARAVGEYWLDQTKKVPVRYTPYLIKPSYNNPYQADTIRYGFGNWLDVVNPKTGQTEQMSGIGAFGTDFWVDRKRNLVGVIFTASNNKKTVSTTFQLIDMIRAEVDRAKK